LQVTTKKIIEIAFDCGYENLSHFHLVFRRRFGVAPRGYRRQHQSLLR
jgi:AraC-like DNA-binding protein